MSDDDLTEYQKGLLQIISAKVPATADQVANALGMLSIELDRLTQELNAFEHDVVTPLVEEHGREYDKAFLAAGFDPSDPGKRAPSEKVREAMARNQTWELRLKMEMAKTEQRKLKRNLDTLDRRIFVGQSIAKTVRSEHRTIGYGQWGD